MSATFASKADMAAKKISFTRLSPNAYAYTAEGDPNSGVIIGDDSCMVIDTTATPVMARDLIARIRQVTDKPIKYVMLTHYHAVRVLGASAYVAEGAQAVVASQGTFELIKERGAQDMKSEIERFPRLFQAVVSIPGLTWPEITFDREMTLHQRVTGCRRAQPRDAVDVRQDVRPTPARPTTRGRSGRRSSAHRRLTKRVAIGSTRCRPSGSRVMRRGRSRRFTRCEARWSATAAGCGSCRCPTAGSTSRRIWCSWRWGFSAPNGERCFRTSACG